MEEPNRQPLPPLTVRCPLLLPALGLCAGAWSAARLPHLSVPLLVALLALAVARRGRPGSALGWLAVGLLWAEVRWVAPQSALASARADRPVEVSGTIAGCWSADEEGASATLRLSRLAQDGAVHDAAGQVRLHLPRLPPGALCGGGLAARGYLRPGHVYRNAIETSVGGWSLWVKSDLLLRRDSDPDLLARLAAAARRRLFPAVRHEDERPGLRLARALLLGDGDALPPLQREGMRRVGLAHLVAVSGLNVGMVATLFLVLLLRAPRGWRLLGTLAGVTAYSLLVGPLPSLLRALLMAVVLLAGLLLARLPAAANGLAAACVVLVLLDPSWIDDLGFQLSVAATAGLLALSLPLRDALHRLGPLAAPLGVTLAAQLATLPWSLAAFGRLSPISPLANLVAIPWAGVGLTVALAWAVARLVLGAAADGLLAALDLLALPLRVLEHLPASAWVSLPVHAGGAAATALTAVLLWCVLRPQPAWSAGVRLAAAGLLAWACAPAGSPPRPELVMLDVGQGDAILLRDGGAALLVDGGGWRTPGFGGRVLVPALASLGVRSLTAAAVTHPDADHCFGTIDLLRELPVARVLAPRGIAATVCGAALRAGPPGRYVELASGDALSIGRWRLRVLGPGAGEDAGTDNRRSLVLRAEALGRCALLTGDLDAAGEAAVLARWGSAAVRCDLLKVAHHGSSGSSTAAFLAAAAPRLALLSVGERNPYGHPSRRVLSALAARHVPALRTDRDGMVRVAWGRPWRVLVTAP